MRKMKRVSGVKCDSYRHLIKKAKTAGKISKTEKKKNKERTEKKIYPYFRDTWKNIEHGELKSGCVGREGMNDLLFFVVILLLVSNFDYKVLIQNFSTSNTTYSQLIQLLHN